MAEEGKAAGADQSSIPDPRLVSEGAISDEALRKAEEFIEQEEGAANRLFGVAATVVTAIAIAMSLFHLYAAYDIVPTQPLRYTHVAFVLVLSFLLFPVARRFRNRIQWWDVIAAAVCVAILVYAIVGGEDFTDRATSPDRLDVVLGVTFIVLLLEATRRTTGWIMPLVALLFIAYAMAGPHLPPPWTHRGYDLSRLVGHLFITLEGIFGVAVDVSATLIIMFTIYGAFLQHSGAGKFFIDFSMALTGGKANSAGRTVVLSSFLLGGPSGSGVATTVTIGAVAYPMMKQAGFEKNAAGGLLAAGGLGAILSPPVLGAAAFLIAEFLKISYLDVIWMAVIPTCLYYMSLVFMVELDAKRFGADAVRYQQPMALGALTRRYGFHFTTLIAVIVFMVAGFSPMLAVFYSTLMCFLFSAMTPETTLGPRRLLLPLLAICVVVLAPAMVNVMVTIINALLRVELPGWSLGGLTDLVVVYLPGFLLALLGVLGLLGLTKIGREETLHTRKLARALSDGSVGVLNAATTCASAGIIVGVVTLTGLGLKFSSIVLDYAGGSLLLTAIYTALVVWIVGLAVPVTASYIICAVIAAPALTKLGVPDYAAHMFIFYYAVLSEVSPPTALSPFAAAAITGGDPYLTTLQAWKYTLPAFLVPFVFVLDPQGVGLLMKIPKDGSAWDILLITAKTAAGLAALAAAAQNWALRQNTTLERGLWVLAGLLLVFPSLLEALAERITGQDLPHPAPVGLAICVALLVKQFMSLAPPAAAKS
jgi:TRAP transporter 4TM/12TM fusion protein